MFEIIKTCKKHGVLTSQDVVFRKTRKTSDCKHCSREWRTQDRLKNPEKYKAHRAKFINIIRSPDTKEIKCSHCKNILEINNFSKCEISSRYPYCTKCRSLSSRISKLKNRETYEKYKINIRIKQREKYLIKKYGLNLEQYKKIHDDQNGLCKICHNPETSLQPNGKEIKDLCVDHCHKTGKVRGLLCHSCNAGIGHFGDSIEKLKSAISYLKVYIVN